MNNTYNKLSLSLSHKLLAPTIIFLSSFLIALIAGASFLSINLTNAATTTNPVEVAVTIDPVISITTDATNSLLNIPIDPTPTGTFGSGNLTVSVHTNNLTGYKLTMNSSSTSTSLEHIVEPTATIPSTAALSTSPTTLATNTWGYSTWTDPQVTNNTPPSTFSAIPSLSTPDTLRTTTAVGEEIDTVLTFAVNADSTIAAGTYVGTMVFTATSNYVPLPPQCPILTGKTYLQDITTPTGPIYGKDRERVVLKDRRNNQDYYVQNIVNQDGTCTAWMETNLRYGGDGNYDPSWGYPDDRYANDDETDGVTTTDTLTDNDNYMPLTGYNGGFNYVAEVVDAGGSTALDTTTPANNTTFYGYLYNWCAAMGGQYEACSNSVVVSADLDQTVSLCPSGWRLPTGDYDGDFDKLNNAVNSGSTTSPQGLIDNWLAVYAGIYTVSMILADQGIYGDYWTFTTDSWGFDPPEPYAAYVLSIGSGIAYPGTDFGYWYSASSIRCVF